MKIKDDVHKTFARFPKKDRERIIFIVEALSVNPFQGDAEKMKGSKNVWRRRIGAYRIFYEIFSKETVVYVFRVERRTSQTY